MKVRAMQGDTVDLLCWRHYGSTAGVVAAVLEANPGIADHGPVLPMGLAVELPEQTTQPTTTRLQLWD